MKRPEFELRILNAGVYDSSFRRFGFWVKSLDCKEGGNDTLHHSLYSQHGY